MERIVEVEPAFEKLSEGYGIGACRIRFVVKGDKGAVQFLVGTDWYVPTAREHLKQFPFKNNQKPEGWDVGYHAKEPQYDGQSMMHEHCEYTDGPCYYDGSGLRADGWVEEFVAGGTAWLWPKLEQEYKETFEVGHDQTL